MSRVTWELALVQSVSLGTLSVAEGYVSATVTNAFVALCSVAILARLSSGRRERLAAVLVGLLFVTGLLVTIADAKLVGTVGAVVSALVWIPQAAHSRRTRSSSGLSWAFVLAGLVSSSLWIAYAVLLGEWRLLPPPTVAILSLLVTARHGLAARPAILP